MIIYLIKSALCLLLLLGFYHLFLEREKMYQFNRMYLLLALFLSIAAPLMPFGIVESWLPGKSSYILSNDLTGSNNTGFISAAGQLIPASELASSRQYILTLLAVYVYIMITAVLLIRFLMGTRTLNSTVRESRSVLYNNSLVVLLDQPTGPFSFLNYIFVNREDYTKGRISREVLIHEQTHIRQKHSLDILAVEIARILFWFNPLYHFLKKAMQINHEFIADEAVIHQTKNRTRYQKILFSALQPAANQGWVSSFNYSLTKKRFQMMNHKRDSGDNLFIQLVAVIILFSSMVLFGIQSEALGQEQKSISIEIGTSQVLKLDGKEIHFSHLEQLLKTFDNPEEYIVHFKVHPNAPFGLITDVQRILRKTNLRRLNYSSEQSELSDPETEAMVAMQVAEARFVQYSEAYMRMKPEEHELAELKNAYNELIEQFNRLRETQTAMSKLNPDLVPPPPPFPPDPERRLNKQN
jgi:hypothetical protein